MLLHHLASEARGSPAAPALPCPCAWQTAIACIRCRGRRENRRAHFWVCLRQTRAPAALGGHPRRFALWGARHPPQEHGRALPPWVGLWALPMTASAGERPPENPVASLRPCRLAVEGGRAALTG